MKKLVLVRHAKSDWGNEFLKDIDRPLNERGYQDAYLMAEWYKENSTVVNAIISSSATRAYSTASIFARFLGIKPGIINMEDDLYETDLKTWLNIISQFNNAYNTIMIFGHNPVITNLANELNKDLFFDNIPTCGIVEIELNITSWKSISENKVGKLLNYKFPKSFKQ